MEDRSRQYSDPFDEKLHAYVEPASPVKAYIPGQGDPEKATRPDVDPSISSGPSDTDRLSAVRVWQNMSKSQETGEGLAKTLFHLSATNPLVSIIFTFYAILVTPLILIFGFVRSIGKDGVSIRDQLVKALAPAIRYELRLINTDVNLYSRGTLSPARLFGILVISPFTSIGVMVAAWTAATFWLYTTILGEPNQKQGKEIDGRSAARGVKNMWQRWLLLGL